MDPTRKPAEAAGEIAPERARSWKRWLPVGVLAAGLVMFFVLGLDRYVSLEALREHREFLTGFVGEWPIMSVLIFIVIYALAIAFSVPGGAVMTVAGGFLFGIWIATAAVVVGATIGAVAVFLAAKTALGDILRARAGSALRKMEQGFRENALSYLLVLRLIPLFPFFVVNLVPAFLGVPLRTYVIGTFLGIIPGTFVYASIGAGLGSLIEMDRFSLKGALTPQVIAALVGLSVLSLLPVIYKKLRGRRSDRQPPSSAENAE